MSTNKPARGAQFTPGPWVVECKKFIATPKAVVIAELNDGLQGEYPESGHINANATLIAAAPAMYAELVAGLVLLEASYQDMCGKYGTDSLHAQTVWERVERTRQVIAQAEGRQG